MNKIEETEKQIKELNKKLKGLKDSEREKKDENAINLYNQLLPYEGKFIKSKKYDNVNYVEQVCKQRSSDDSLYITLLLASPSGHYDDAIYSEEDYDDPGYEIARCAVTFTESDEFIDSIDEFNENWELATKEEFLKVVKENTDELLEGVFGIK